MKNKFAVLLQIVFIYFSWQQGQRLLSGLFTRCSQWASLGPRSFNFMLLKLRLIFIWWQELLSAGLDIVAGLKEFLSDVQSAGVKPLWETARGRQNSAQSTTGEEGDKPPCSWCPASGLERRETNLLAPGGQPHTLQQKILLQWRQFLCSPRRVLY